MKPGTYYCETLHIYQLSTIQQFLQYALRVITINYLQWPVSRTTHLAATLNAHDREVTTL